MRANHIVPVAVKLVLLAIDRSKLCVGHFDAILTMPLVEFCVNMKALSRSSVPNQIVYRTPKQVETGKEADAVASLSSNEIILRESLGGALKWYDRKAA